MRLWKAYARHRQSLENRSRVKINIYMHYVHFSHVMTFLKPSVANSPSPEQLRFRARNVSPRAEA